MTDQTDTPDPFEQDLKALRSIHRQVALLSPAGRRWLSDWLDTLNDGDPQ